MGFLIRLFSKNGLFLFFLFLQLTAVTLIFSRNSMQQSFLAAQTTAFNAWVSGYIDQGTSYLRLKQINEDLVAQNKDVLVFVEVKTRSSEQFGAPEEAVNAQKQKQMVKLAEWYAQKNTLSKMKMRFDVIAILYNGVNAPQIRHIQHAFEAI